MPRYAMQTAEIGNCLKMVVGLDCVVQTFNGPHIDGALLDEKGPVLRKDRKPGGVLNVAASDPEPTLSQSYHGLALS